MHTAATVPAALVLGNRASLSGAVPARRLRLTRFSRATLHLVTARSGGRRPDRPAAAPPLPVPSPPVVPEVADGSRGWRTFWTAIDTSAWLGTVGTAVAFILTQEAMLAGAPVVLPLLALYASRQREKLAAAAAQREQLARLEALLLDLQAETADEVAAEVGAEVQGLLQQLQQQRAAGSSPSPEVGKLLRGLDSKLSSMEGSVTGTGAATRDALQRSAEQQGQLATSVMARLQDLGTALRRDVNGALQAAGEVEMGALARLDARMAALEGSINGLQAAQSDGLMRLNGGLQAAVADVTGALQEAVREETYRSLDPLRRLPELVQGALPVTPEVLVGPVDGGSSAVSEESLRQLIGEALGGATRQILEELATLLEELAAQPQAIAPQQWSQLGARLASLQAQMQDLAELQVAGSQAAAAAGGGGQADDGGGMAAAAAAAAASAEVAAVAAELSGLRSDLGSLTRAVQQLLDMQQQQQQQQQQQAGGVAVREGTGSLALPGTTMAGVAAAVQAVQDQVVLLRQDLEEGDASYASVMSLEQQLEVALAALFQDLAVVDSPSSGGGSTDARGAGKGDSAAAAAASAAAASAVAQEQQQAALSAALESLAALGGRLDGMSAQLAALQAGMAAVAAAPAAAAPVPPAEVVLQNEASGQRQQQEQEQVPEPALVSAASTAAPEGKEAAFRRMQELLQQQSERAKGGSSNGDNGGTAFAEWLSGHRDNGVPASTAVGAAGPAGAAASSSSSSSSDFGSNRGLQQQIEFAAAIGMPLEGAETAAVAGSGTASVPANAAAGLPSAMPYNAPFDAPESARSQPAVPWQGNEAPANDALEQQYEPTQLYEQQQYEQQYQAQNYEQGEQQQQQYEQYEQQQAQPPPPGLQQQQQGVGQGFAPSSAEQLYEQGVQLLRQGRALAATPGADLELADGALRDAAASFEQVLSLHDPSNIRARGNYGNALLSQGRLKKQMIDAMGAAAVPGELGQAAAVAEEQQRLEAEAEELLLLAGRQYKAVLEADPQQSKAFINWGRVIGLRADMARTAGDVAEGGRLFGLAADKFDAALDLEPQNLPALRLGGQAVLDAALCLLGSDPTEARALLKDAAAYLEAALALDAQDGESAVALQRCRQQLAAMREQRQAQA